MHSKGSFIVQNFIQLTISRLQEIFTYSKQICQLPSVFYIILLFYWFFLSSFPLLLSDIDDIWSDSPYLHNIIKFFQVFWRFSSCCTDTIDLVISFNVIVIVPIICLIPLIVSLIKFTSGHSFSQSLAYFICLIYEIFLVFYHAWYPSELATVVGMVWSDEYDTGLLHIIIIIFLVLFGCFHIAFSHYFVFCESTYSSGRVIFWDSPCRLISILFIDAILFFTRLVEVLPRIPAICFVFVTVAICILKVFFCLLYFPFTVMICNPFCATCTFSFMIAFILLCISHFAVHIHIVIILFVLLVLTIVSDIVFKKIWEKIVDKYLNMNESLISEEYQLIELVKNPQQFLLLVRFGFINGHPYVFTWRPFKQALVEWPGNKRILFQYMKFVAIYSQESSLLNDLLADTKYIKDYQFRNFRRQIKVIRESRNWLILPKLKRSLKEIDDDVKTVKNYIVSYWNAVKDNSFNTSFDIGKHLNEKISMCHLSYLHLISLYPNSSLILTNYIKFLQNVMCNPRESQYWLQRKEYLSNKNNFTYDLTQNAAFKMFPAIPRVLRNLSVRTDENSSVQSLLSDSKPSNPSQLTDMTEKTAYKVYDPNEEIDLTASTIYDHGKKAPVPFLRALFGLTFLLFFLSCILGFIIPITVTANNQKEIKSLFVSVKTISEISKSFSALSYFFLYESLISEHILPSYHEIPEILNYTHHNNEIHISTEETVKMLLIDLNNDLHTFEKTFGHEIPVNTYTSRLIQDTTVDFISLNTSTNLEGNVTYTLNIFQALNFLYSYLFKFAEENLSINILDNDWKMIIHLNTREIPTIMINLMNYATRDMISTIESTSSIIWKIFVIILTCDIVILPFFIYLTIRIKYNWIYIMKTINSLPRVAIQKVITRNSKEEDDEDRSDGSLKQIGTNDEKEKIEEKKKKKKLTKRAEFKYQDLFLQMVSASDTSSGVPIAQILILLFFSLIINAAAFILVFFIHKSLENQLRSMPIRYYLPNLVSTTNFGASTLFLRRLLIGLDNPLLGDSLEKNIEDFKETLETLEDNLNLFIFGRTNITNGGTITSKSKQLSDLLYDSKGDWFVQHSLFDSLQMLPNYFSLEIIFDIYTIMAGDGVDPNFVFDPKDKVFLTYLLYATEHMPKEFIYLISEDSSSQFYISFKNTLATIVLVEVILFVVGSASFVILIYQLSVVYRTVHFSLSALSMVDYEYFQDLTSILDLFAGVYSGTDCIKALNNSMTEMIDVIHEAVIELNEELLVIDANDEMLDWLNLKMYQLKGTRFTNHIVFSDNKVEKSIMDTFNGVKKEEIIEMDSEVFIVSRSITEKRSFEIIHFHNENQNVVIIIFKTSHDLSSMRQQISNLKEQIDKLTKYAIPSQLRHKECLRGQSHIYNAHFISLVAIEIMNLNEFALNRTPKETASFYNTFVNKVNELCEKGDRIKFNQLGRFIFIAFNLVKQTPNYYGSVNDSISFLYDVNDYALENKYMVRYASTLLKSVIANLNGMQFSLFSGKISNVKTLLKYSKASCVTYSSKFHDLLPRKMTKDAIQVKIAASDIFSEKQSWAFSLKLVEKSLRS